jgi:hypothetical protein
MHTRYIVLAWNLAVNLGKQFFRQHNTGLFGIFILPTHGHGIIHQKIKPFDSLGSCERSADQAQRKQAGNRRKHQSFHFTASIQEVVLKIKQKQKLKKTKLKKNKQKNILPL